MQERAGPITLVLADDHTVMRSGLRMLLDAEEDIDVLGEAGNIEGAYRSVRQHRPRVLLLDLNMPGGSSIAAISRLARISPGTSIVVLTMEDDPVFAREAFAAGASAYVLKDAPQRELVRVVREAAGRGQ